MQRPIRVYLPSLVLLASVVGPNLLRAGACITTKPPVLFHLQPQLGSRSHSPNDPGLFRANCSSSSPRGVLSLESPQVAKTQQTVKAMMRINDPPPLPLLLNNTCRRSHVRLARLSPADLTSSGRVFLIMAPQFRPTIVQ